MTSVDDLKAGDFITVVNFRTATNPYTGIEMQPSFDGQPLCIMAISLPFIAVNDGGIRFSLDMRECHVQRVDRKYVRAMGYFNRGEQQGGGSYRPKPQKQKKRKRKNDGRTCPLCGGRLKQQMKVSEPGNWRVICGDCGREPPKGSLPIIQ